MPPGVLRSLAIGLFSCPNETGMTDEHTPKQAIMRLPQTNVQKFLGQPTSLEASQRFHSALVYRAHARVFVKCGNGRRGTNCGWLVNPIRWSSAPILSPAGGAIPSASMATRSNLAPNAGKLLEAWSKQRGNR
jgi:hypothetical protein